MPDETAADHICKVSEAAIRAVSKSRKLPGWDILVETEILEMSTRLIKLSRGVHERASESA